ncbi:hypothetical protein OH799_17355 [Nocardia sp. NBC_00881]|uniref:hypothetical protein n=1 Tax=Nocardia sp. NBC_00881 TaxID=2975995 RepID=UPI00386CD4AE|nr:hypothetical protein OH799_17355 [Nocardia sp. NBC_00881]
MRQESRVTPVFPFARYSLLRIASIAVVTAASGALIGCSSDSNPSVTTMPIPKPPVGAVECVAVQDVVSHDQDEKKLTAIISELQLPAGTCFFAVDMNDIHDQPGKIYVHVDLTVPGSTGPDDLRAAATDIAHALKGTEVAQRTAELSVTNWGFSRPPYRAFLSDKNFQNHPWDGTPSRQSELAIWEVDPCAGCTR